MSEKPENKPTMAEAVKALGGPPVKAPRLTAPARPAVPTPTPPTGVSVSSVLDLQTIPRDPVLRPRFGQTKATEALSLIRALQTQIDATCRALDASVQALPTMVEELLQIENAVVLLTMEGLLPSNVDTFVDHLRAALNVFSEDK